MLLGRLAECAVLDGLVDAARAGHSRVLVVRGPAGVGKTALLSYAIDSAAGLRIARVSGVESEMELAFAALQQLCAPMLDLVDQLPDPQRDALSVAFGLRAGEAPDRFLLGLAVRGLLSDAAVQRPLLCVVDDAHWLDGASAQVLGFVARRLAAEPVTLLFAAREPGAELTGLPELALGGLSDCDARTLLGSVPMARMDERVADQIVAEARGNPLALLELPRALTPAQLTGGFGVLDAPDLTGRMEDTFQRRHEALPADTQQLLLVAAAEPTGEPVLLWRAAGQLGIEPQAAGAAEASGLVTITDRVAFRHPLVRSAVYRAAPPQARRVVHGALAGATDPRTDPDRHAWHRAEAAQGPDDDVASELERSASRARARGGYAAAAAFLQRSAALTADPERRVSRMLAAADAKYQAGAFDAALRLLAAAQAGPLDDLQRAQADLLRGQVVFASGHSSQAPPLLLKAAQQFEQLDARLARETYLEALSDALWAGCLATGTGLREVAEAALAVPMPQPARAPDLLLDGMALLITHGFGRGAPMLKRAVSAFRAAGICDDEGLKWLSRGCGAAQCVWDDDSWDVLSARLVQLVRGAGALTELPVAFSMRAGLLVVAGQFDEAAALVAQRESVTEATGTGIAPYGALTLAVMQGREAEALGLIEAGTRDVQRRGEGAGLSYIRYATAVLCNSLGRYEQALAAAQQASEDSPVMWFSMWALPELIEAAARSGAHDHAARAFQRLSHSTRASRTDWALGIEARSRALVTDGTAAETCYREAIDRLGRTRLRIEYGRAHLLYGEWLRRQQRRRDARDQLHVAGQIFHSVGAAGFAERARTELRATGEHARKRASGTANALTEQEAMIARLAGQGASNPQIAAQLFISPATVAYHLRKVFTKLGVTSRHQLARALPTRQDATTPASPHG
jgi:DNA-binding CsgD family transcriptional regulator/tetratricopeptide (TPR) repeat protein